MKENLRHWCSLQPEDIIDIVFLKYVRSYGMFFFFLFKNSIEILNIIFKCM